MHLRATSVKLALLLALLVPALLLGQANVTGLGTVTGRVTDASGAIIAGATISLTDISTNITITATANSAGLYIFDSVAPGNYNVSVSNAGFRKSVVPNQPVEAGATLTLNFALEVGAVTETVQVTATSEAELQTLNSTMSSTLQGDVIQQLPLIARDVSALTFLQATTAPTFNGAEGNTTSGNVAGAMADQNTFMLDGGNNTSDLDGDNATYVTRNGSGVMPTPAESVEEFQVNTNNMTADFSTSGGGQIQVSTKRGTNQFHGSAYDWFQADWLSTNDWYNNEYDQGKPKSHYNRFGGSLGGPLLPDFLGGKTYFFVNYEGEQYPRTGPFSTNVPSALFRQGIIQEYDATGNVVQYNLKTSTMCGTSGGMQCDPRGIGISPTINQLWNTYEPMPNGLQCGDKLNTQCFTGNLTYPLSNNFGVIRVDHDFGPKWRAFVSYRYFGRVDPTTNQVDIGGVLPGDKLGVPATASSDPLEPRYFVGGLTTTISPSLTNDFHFSYLRNDWSWIRAGAVPEISGIPGSLEVGGETSTPLAPINVDTQDARARLWDGHDYDYRDGLSWLRGTHLLQFGGDALHQNWRFDRYDNVVGGLTSLVYNISSADLNMGSNFQPIPCTGSVTTNCLPSSGVGNWNGAYAELAGIVADTSIVATRSGANLNLNPLGTPVRSNVIGNSYSLYFNDSWKIKPNLTLNYGLNWNVQVAPYDVNGSQDVLVDPAGTPISVNNYLAQIQTNANLGQIYNPGLGFSPVGAIGPNVRSPIHTFWGALGPRLALAWNPDAGGGWMQKLLGGKATVIRVGYGRTYSRNLGIDQVSTPVLGDGFLQPVACSAPNSSGACTSPLAVDPTNAFRIGVDGQVAPLPAIPQTLQSPVLPGINAAGAELVAGIDPAFRPGVSDQVDFSIQRQFAGNTILEVGYVGIYSRHLFQGVDVNDVPWMIKVNGQTFANAYDNLYNQLTKGQTVTPQPFFEQALKGSPYCSGFSSCTAAVASNESSYITTASVTNLWSDLDSNWTAFGTALPSSVGQCFYCYMDTSDGFSNYNALVVKVQKRYSSGLTFNANFTYGRSLGTLALNQAYTLNNVNNPWDLNYDYGPQFWDRKFTFNLLGSYTLPFGKGRRWANSNVVATRVLGGWTLSPILTIASGTPLDMYTGSFQELGNGFDGNGCQAVPLTTMSYTPSVNYNYVGTTVAEGNNIANGGTGANLFSNPAAVYNNFRPFLVGEDTSCGGGGQLRGQNRWNLDLGLTKDTRITERFGFQIYAQAFNALNHFMWSDPGIGLLGYQSGFGALTGQYNALTLGGAGASANYTRIIQLGLRVSF
jgi:hypothetical protein